MKTLFAFLSLLIALDAFAQSATPPMVIVQAATTTAATPAPAAVAAQDPNSLRSALQGLEQMKAANEDTLKRQQAVLQQLEELQKAADQIKIFSHRAGG